MRHYFTVAEFNEICKKDLSNKPMEDAHSRYVIETLF